ncbi:MAG: hypothetical protein AABY53_02145 [Bdellovibrionota bacterium]
MPHSKLDKKDYFDYVVNVLGVKSILLNQESTNVLQVVPLLICVDHYSDYNNDEKDLLARMIAALKIDLQLIKVIDSKQSSLFQPEFTIFFQDDPAQNSQSTANTVITYSPRILLKNTQYKKNAWDELQKVMLFFRVAT